MDAEKVAQSAAEDADIEDKVPTVLTASWSERSKEIRVIWQGSHQDLKGEEWDEVMGCLIDLTAEAAGIEAEEVSTLFEWERD